MPDGYIDLVGLSGATYRYYTLLFPRDASAIMACSGNYAFLKALPNGLFAVLYIGESENLSERISGHDRWLDAVRLGITHVVAHTTLNAMARLSEERDLIARLNPPLNAQYRTAG